MTFDWKSLARAIRHHHNAIRLLIRQSIEQNRLDRTENGRARANAERQRQDAHDRKARAVAQSARCVPQIDQNALEHILPTRVAHLLHCITGITQLQAHLPLRLRTRQPARNQCGNFLLVVMRDLVVELAIDRGAVCQSAQAAQKLAW